MPELPEVEIVRRGLLGKIIGETIAKVEIYREQSIGYPAPEKFSQVLRGETFVDISRRGKYLLLHLKPDSILIIHLRMSGRVLLFEKNQLSKKMPKFLRVRFLLHSGRQLCFEDMRVFGRLWYVTSPTALSKAIPSFAQLGLEPLGPLTSKQLLDLLAGRRQPIKSALLDQTLLTGIGNIYADEILFQAGIHPLLPAGNISPTQARRLAKIIPLTLNKAIALGGSSIKDFVDSDGVNGNYQDDAFVYGRAGKPCLICKSKIERLKISGRSAHFCFSCQSYSRKNPARGSKKKRSGKW